MVQVQKYLQIIPLQGSNLPDASTHKHSLTLAALIMITTDRGAMLRVTDAMSILQFSGKETITRGPTPSPRLSFVSETSGRMFFDTVE